MPANLTPDYYAAENRYRAAKTATEKIACLEEMLMVMPKHKGTDHLKADLRRKISKLKQEGQARKSGGKRESPFRVAKEGAGQVMVVGPANTGKSSLVAALTNAEPDIADFPMSTWKPTPGMLAVGGIQIQLVDTPPIATDFVEPEFVDMFRRGDMILLVVDVTTDPAGQLEKSIAFLEEHRIVPQHLKHKYEGVPRVLTVLPFLVLANKCDNEGLDENVEIMHELIEKHWTVLPVSAKTGRNLKEMSESLPGYLGIIRVYSKRRGKPPDMDEPFVLKMGSTIEDLATKVHKEIAGQLRGAKVWGHNVFDGQMVKGDYVLEDEDVVELHF